MFVLLMEGPYEVHCSDGMRDIPSFIKIGSSVFFFLGGGGGVHQHTMVLLKPKFII
jgi:hypothetical protein